MSDKATLLDIIVNMIVGRFMYQTVAISAAMQ